MFKFFAFILVPLLLQGCSVIFRADYFRPSFETATFSDEYCHAHLGGSVAGIESKFSGPDRVAKFTYKNSAISFCSTTTENDQGITIGPLFLAIIPMPISTEATDNSIVIGVRHESNVDKISIEADKPYLITNTGEKLLSYKHEDREYPCYGYPQTRYYTEENKSIQCHIYKFYFNRESLSGLEYKFHLIGVKLNEDTLPDIEVLFSRERATFYIITG